MTTPEARVRLRELDAKPRSVESRFILERYRELRNPLPVAAALEQAEREWVERLVALEESRVEAGPWGHLQ